MAQVWEYIKIALMNIKSNKGRSILTMLGIIIGISSVIMIISVGNGVKRGINDTLESIVGGQISLYIKQENEEGIYIEFTEQDIDMIKQKVPHVKTVTSVDILSGSAVSRKGTINASVRFGMPGMVYAKNEPIVAGRYFTEGEYEAGIPVCVVTEKSARALFGNTDVVGLSFEINVWGMIQEFTIVGVQQDSAAVALMDEMEGMASGEELLYVEMDAPKTVMDNLYGFYPGVYEILIVSEAPEYASQVVKDSVRLMENKYGVRGKNLFGVQNFADMMGQMDQILTAVTAFIVVVAAISLLVGGIGVMNIMLVSVTERTREIGIRKALGAKTASITLQFLSESAIITLLGGIIGIVLGVLGATGVCALMKDMKAYVSIGTVLGTTVFSSAVGIFFGIYPARKAAKMSPIEALRHE